MKRSMTHQKEMPTLLFASADTLVCAELAQDAGGIAITTTQTRVSALPKPQSLRTLFWCALWACLLILPFAQLSAQTPAIPCDSAFKQVLLLVDVSGSMTENERLLEVKQFALRMLKEREKERLLYKIISFGGECNDIQTDVDWTRDGSVVSAGIKSLYLRGGTPLGSALEYSIDAVKKSAYPDQTQILLFNDGANTCGDVREILARRGKEIPCVRIHVLGIELDEEDKSLTDRSTSDLEAIRSLGNGKFIRLRDIREVRGVSFAENQVTVSPQSFPPRVKKSKQEATKQEATKQEITKQEIAKKDSTAQNPAQVPPTQAIKRDSAQTVQAQGTKSDTAQTQQTQAIKRDSAQRSTAAVNEQKSSSSLPSATPNTNQAERKEASSVQEKKQNSEPKRIITQNNPQNNTQNNTQTRSTPSTNENVSQKETLLETQTQPEKKKSIRQVHSPKAASKAPSKASSKVSSRAAEKSSAMKLSSEEPASPQPSKRYASTEKQEQSPSTVQSSVASNAVSLDSSSFREEGIILFYPTGSDKLLPQMTQGLERLVERLRMKTIRSISVEGHSSIEGNGATNLRLSVQRASGVAALLRSRLGLSERVIVWNAFGELKPLASNATEVGRQENRRVEVRVQVAE